MRDVAVTLYAAHLPGGAVPARAHFIGPQLVLEGAHPLRVAAAQLTARRGGFDDDNLFLDWQVGDQAYSLMPADAAALQMLLTHAPPALAPQLRRWRGQVGLQRFTWRAVLGSLAALVVAVLVLLWQSERVAGYLATLVPLERERALGEAALTQFGGSEGLQESGPAAEQIKALGERLTQGSRYTYRWYVKQDDSVNAMALPGGIVVVHSGLMEKAQSAEELAAVLAHEVQHIEQRHGLQQMIHSAGWAALLAVTLGDVSAISAIAVHQLGNLRNSRKLEAQADAAGVAALVQAGIAPQGMATFFRRMAAQEQGAGVAWLSSHPAPEERLADIEALVRAHPCSACAPLPPLQLDV